MRIRPWHFAIESQNMNQRELLSAAAVAVGVPLSGSVAVDETNKNQLPLIVVSTKRRLNQAQQRQAEENLDAQAKRNDCRIIFFSDCDHIEIASSSQAKCGFTERMGDYSISVFGQSMEDIDKWRPKMT